MKKEKKKILIRGMAIACIICLVTAFLPLLSEPETVYAASCPGRSDSSLVRSYVYGCGCHYCGGTIKRPWEPDGAVKYNGFPLEYRGSGLNVVRNVTDRGAVWDIYYRCFNCGVTSENAVEVYRVFISSPKPAIADKYKDNKTTEEFATGKAAYGYVPWHYCNFCGKWQDGSAGHNTCYRISASASPSAGGSVSVLVYSF